MNWSNFLMTMLLWGAVHFLGDFAFQSAWMAIKKVPANYNPAVDLSCPNEVLLYHCLTYTATFVIAAKAFGEQVNPLAFLIIFLAHVVVDWHKARGQIVKACWLDQMLHILTLVPLILMGWL